MSLYLGNNLISGVASPVEPTRNIGQIIPSTIPLTDAGLHLLDGSLIQGSGIYSAFVDYIAGLVTDYPNLFCTEAQWQTAVNTYGVCGKFVYDSVNNTVRLPKYNSKIYTGGGTAPVAGNGKGLGLTDGTTTGCFGNYSAGYNASYYNATLGSDVGSSYSPIPSAGTKVVGVVTDGSKSGLIAQLSDINTSLDGYYYIVIATSTKTQIQVDIDEVMTDLNGKADVDLTNCTDVADIKMAHNAMPSNTYIDLTLGASGSTYTAPADGWFCFYTIKSTAGYTYLSNNTTTFRTECRSTINGAGCGCYMPARKGDIIACNYDGVNKNPFWRFYYAVGSESEAN